MLERVLIPFILLLAAGFSAAPAVLAEQLAPDTFLTARDLASNDCEVLIPVGPAFRLERVSSTDLSLFVLGQAAPAGAPLVHSRCLESVRMMPLTEGDGVRVDLHIRPDALRSIEQSAGRLRLVLSAPADAGTEEASTQETLDTYRIGKDDKLSIVVARPDYILREVIVDRDGNITFDYVGTVRVEGLTPVEAANKLRDLLDGNYLVNPEVSVAVKEYASQFVFVDGQVRNPGKKALRGGTTLKDVLAEAGGLTDQAGDEVTVTRAQKQPSEPERVIVSRREIDWDRANLRLRPGDSVTVSEKRYVFLYGEVGIPNRYPYEPGMTLLQSIAMAGGLKEWANRKDVRVLRSLSGSIERYDLRDIEKQKIPDVRLQPGDIITVQRRLL
ncbi:MAG: hypothetical protein DMF49_04465 [Acidobacteria bacterium]|nr:MAG: hypothetical protein DMF49_04465 [Acidobacteriota bacterium]